MSEFRVRTGHLEGFAVALGDAGGDVSAIESYLMGHCGDTSGWSGLMSQFVGEYSSARDTFDQTLVAAGSGLTSASTRLSETAATYEQADRGSSSSMPGGDPAIDSAGETVAYPAGSDPTTALVAPGDYSGVVAQQLDDVMGPISIVNDVIEWISGWSLLAAIFEPLSGDYGQLYAHADAWDSTGTALGRVASNLEDGVERLDPHWDGGASEAFFGRMERGTGDLRALVEGTGEVASGLRDAAKALAETLDAAAQTLNAIVSTVSAGLAGASIPFAGQAYLVKKVWDAVKLIRGIVQVISALAGMILAVKEIIEAMIAICHTFDGFGE